MKYIYLIVGLIVATSILYAAENSKGSVHLKSTPMISAMVGRYVLFSTRIFPKIGEGTPGNTLFRIDTTTGRTWVQILNKENSPHWSSVPEEEEYDAMEKFTKFEELKKAHPEWSKEAIFAQEDAILQEISNSPKYPKP